MPEQTKSLMIEDAKIIFRNFAGRETMYNSPGDRNFSVLLEPAFAEKLTAEGWRVKQLKDREQDGEIVEGDRHLKVVLNYKKGRPPRVVMVTSRGRTDLGVDEVALMDVADIEKCDIMLNGWWSDNAGGGYSAYLKSIFITVREDELDRKYSGIQDLGNPEADTPPWAESEES